MEKFNQIVSDSLKNDLISALEGWLGKESGQNVDALADRLLEVQGMHCKCQSRKCLPHPYRCWPSRAAWITVGMLLFVLCCLIGNQFTERQEMWHKWQAHWDQAAQARWEQIDQTLAEHAVIVQRADHYVWATSTTESSKWVQLRDAIERLQSPRRKSP